MNPCGCENIPKSLAAYIPGEHCSRCTAYVLDPDGLAARAWKGLPPLPPKVPCPGGGAECRHKGDPVPGAERARRGLDHAKGWRYCLHIEKPLGEIVCPCQGCGPACPRYGAETVGSIAISFKHGLGDAANFAHMIPLYVRRGYRVQVHPGHADHAPVFRAGGAEIVDRGDIVRWPEGGGHNKNALNLGRAPMPSIGDPSDLWQEYVAVRLDFSGQVIDADRESVAHILADLPRPIVALHVIGFSWTNGQGALRNYPEGSTRRLASLLLKGMPGSVVFLDRDRRAPRIADPRIRYFHDYSPGQLYEVLDRVEVLAGIDSGPLNFVRFTKAPAVGIWTNHHPADYLLPRPETRNVVACRHAGRLAAPEWNVIISPDDGPSPPIVAAEVLKVLSMDPIVLRGLRSTSFGRDYYEEHREAGLDYLGHGDWQEQYGRWLIDSLGLAGKSILDVGCACGSIARGLSKAGAIVQGVDVNEHMIALGRERWPDMQAMLHVADACNLHLYRDGEWDALHSAQVAEHWPPHLVPIILRELARVTKPGGLFFCCLDTAELFERQGRKIEHEDPTHVCVKPMAWWHEQLETAGWKISHAFDAALAGHAESFLSRYDWDWCVARKP